MLKKKIKNFTTASTDRILFKRVIYNKISVTTNRQKNKKMNSLNKKAILVGYIGCIVDSLDENCE